MPKIIHLGDVDVLAYFDEDVKAEQDIQEAFEAVNGLMKALIEMRDRDSEMVQNTIPLLERAANWVDLYPGDDIASIDRIKFKLERVAGQSSFVWNEFLFGSIISSKGEEDLLRLNP